MAFNVLSEEVVGLTKDLVTQITGFQHGNTAFSKLSHTALQQIEKSDTMSFPNKPDVDSVISSMVDKFALHGLVSQSRRLKKLYEKLTNQVANKDAMVNRLNAVRFLLEASERPTAQAFTFASSTLQRGDSIEIVDWAEYLREGVERWSPAFDNSDSDLWSEGSEESVDYHSTVSSANTVPPEDGGRLDLFFGADDGAVVEDYWGAKAKLLAAVQGEWFNQGHVAHRPVSTDRSANLAFEWDKHVTTITGGILTQKTNIISEYKVLREVLWQLQEPHSSVIFHFVKDKFCARSAVTIASVRPQPFEKLMNEFAQYAEWLQDFRLFHDSIKPSCEEAELLCCDTYRSYDNAVRNIVNPILDTLRELEAKISLQESTITVLSVAKMLKPAFRTIEILHRIHKQVVLDYTERSPLECATTLVSRLHAGLKSSTTKLEQDLYLSLYLESLYKYLSIAHTWIERGVLEDERGEFIIEDNNPKVSLLFNTTLITKRSVRNNSEQRSENWEMDFSVKDVGVLKSDPVLSQISTKAFQTGKNVHLLMLLGKLHGLEKNADHTETLYGKYIRIVLQEVALVSGCGDSVAFEDETEEGEESEVAKIPYLENLADASNPFLAEVFLPFFSHKNRPGVAKARRESLFDKVRKVSKTTLAVDEITEKVFGEILQEKFEASMHFIREELVACYEIESQLAFFAHVFLFKDDLIFPLYRRIFLEFANGGAWGNQIWLTSHLQDIIMDTYPNFYERCSVQITDPNWRLCEDPLKACKTIQVQYSVKWPVNIIIRDEHCAMYREIFQFVLGIKWALFTLNQLFVEFQSKNSSMTTVHKTLNRLVSRMKILRFYLSSCFGAIQHYVLGYVYNKHLQRFLESFQAANDLDSLIRSHQQFVSGLHRDCVTNLGELNSSSNGFYTLLYVVRELSSMWTAIKERKKVEDCDLEDYEKIYFECYEVISPIIYPSQSLP